MLPSRWLCGAASSLNVGVQCFRHVSIFSSKSKVENADFCKEWGFLTFVIGGPRDHPQKLLVSRASILWFYCTFHGMETSAGCSGLSGSFFQHVLSCFSHVWLCATPETAAHQAPPYPGFSRQERWSGLPFPSPVHESEKWKWSRSVVSDSSDPMDYSLPGSSVHGIF